MLISFAQLGAAVIELATSVHAFWGANGTAYRAETAREQGSKGGLNEATLKMPAARVTWLCAAFLLCYVGSEVALGGWVSPLEILLRELSD